MDTATLNTSDQIILRHIDNIIKKLNHNNCALAYQLSLSYQLGESKHP